MYSTLVQTNTCFPEVSSQVLLLPAGQPVDSPNSNFNTNFRHSEAAAKVIQFLFILRFYFYGRHQLYLLHENGLRLQLLSALRCAVSCKNPQQRSFPSPLTLRRAKPLVALSCGQLIRTARGRIIRFPARSCLPIPDCRAWQAGLRQVTSHGWQAPGRENEPLSS